MKAGTAPPSYTLELIEGKTLTYEEEDLIKWTTANIYTGGTDTTMGSLNSFFLAMAMYPKVQKRAQEELDRVVGPDRLPSFTDREKLPYFDLLFQELVRWAPLAPLGAPHQNSREEIYRGYRIPKGSIIFSNVWAITHDENIYKNPDEFRPERFSSEGGNIPEFDPRNVTFGYGRRVCPGRNLADLSVWITMVMSLHVYKMTPPEGVTLKCEFINGSVIRPKPYKCTFTPRSAKAVELIRSVSMEEEYTFMGEYKAL